MRQPNVGELWQCVECDYNNNVSNMFHPFVDIGDIVEILDISDPIIIRINNLRTGHDMRENRFRIMYFYRLLNVD